MARVKISIITAMNPSITTHQIRKIPHMHALIVDECFGNARYIMSPFWIGAGAVLDPNKVRDAVGDV
jgi:hypothetical protein